MHQPLPLRDHVAFAVECLIGTHHARVIDRRGDRLADHGRIGAVGGVDGGDDDLGSVIGKCPPHSRLIAIVGEACRLIGGQQVGISGHIFWISVEH